MQNLQLKNVVATLEGVRDRHNSELDASVLTELDEVIYQLRLISDGDKSKVCLDDALVCRVLTLIVQVLSSVTNFAELVRHLTDIMNGR